MKREPETPTRLDPPLIKVLVTEKDGEEIEFQFGRPFQIGRDESCEIQVKSLGISRKHAEVFFSRGRWWIKDLKSTNGIFFSGERVNRIPLGKSTKVELGNSDVFITFMVEGFSPVAMTLKEEGPSVTQYVKRYFEDSSKSQAGDHTRLIRGAFQVVQKKERKKYFIIIGIIVLIAIFIGLYAYYQQQQIQKQRALAEQLFYSMKSLELELARMTGLAQLEGDSASLKSIEQYQERQLELSRNYEKFLEQLHFYEDSQWSDKDRIILQVARLLGECELGMPKEFLDEVYRFIQKWKTSDRLEKALYTAMKNGYTQTISQIMLEYHLPPQFLYLALQESDFNAKTVGPKTRFGIAKGIWQFIPATAARYGLNTGPLVGLRRYDPKDERFDFEKSTRSAARYIRDIYDTEAQASGLLVIASYNWGERKVRQLLQKMPQNPQERNFWELLKLYKNEIPQETYDYVFYIISATVIGENPELFGFSFENPLKTIVRADGE